MPRVIDFPQLESVDLLDSDFIPVVRPGDDLIVQFQNLRDKLFADHLAAADPHSQYALKTSLSTLAASGSWNDIQSKPSTFPPSAHVHSYEPLGAVSSHVASLDPHVQYALESSLATVATTGSYNDLTNLPSAASVSPGISGLEVSNVTADLITISPGWCSINVNGALRVVNLSSSLTKSIASVWAAGNNQGGLAAGSRATNTTYWIHLIFNPNTNAVDVLFSTSIVASDRPVGWFAQPILPFTTESANSNIRGFSQSGDRVHLSVGELALNGSFSTTANNLLTCPGLPQGVPVIAFGSVFSSGAAGLNIRTENNRVIHTNGIAGAGLGNGFEALSNSSRQIPLWATVSATGSVTVNGYKYNRLSRIGV